jgi:hypothetical protein
MIRLLSALVAGAILAVSFPSTAHAASPATNKQIARTFQQLKRLPNAGAGAPRVRQFLRKLAILNPKGASTYYKFAIRKLSPADAERAAGQLLRQVTVIVQKSGLFRAAHAHADSLPSLDFRRRPDRIGAGSHAPAHLPAINKFSRREKIRI